MAGEDPSRWKRGDESKRRLAMRHRIEHALTDGSVPARKALPQALVHENRVEGRDRVVPWFRVPGGAEPKVRALARLARSSRLAMTWPDTA